MRRYESNRVSDSYDVLAPDGSEIRLLHQLGGVSVVHCRLPLGAVTIPVRHRTVEEVWYFLAGKGQVWRKQGRARAGAGCGAGHELDDSAGHGFPVPQHGGGAAGISHCDKSALARRG